MGDLKKYFEPPKLYATLIMLSVIAITLFVIAVVIVIEFNKFGNIPVGRD